MTMSQQPADDAAGMREDDSGEAPVLPQGEDVRVGPEQSDEPQAGAAEPTD